MDAPHPFGVSLGQVVVHRHHVHPLALQGIEVHRHGGHQGLAFARPHLGDHAAVQGAGTDDLHVEMALAEHPAGCLSHDRVGLGLQVVE